MEYLHSALNHVIQHAQLGNQVWKLLNTQMDQLEVNKTIQHKNKSALDDEQTTKDLISPIRTVHLCVTSRVQFLKRSLVKRKTSVCVTLGVRGKSKC